MFRSATRREAWRVRVVPAVLLLAGAARPATPAIAQDAAPTALQGAGAFQTSCGPRVASDIRTGVALLFLTESVAARATFERARAAAPSCAIASWGVALASLGLPDARPDEAAQDRASRALARARRSSIASDRERAYVDAATPLIEPRSSPYAARLRAFAAAARVLGRTYPDDAHPAMLVALACLAQSTTPADMGQREAATAIVLRLGEAPDDPAAATLLALARDNASDAADARRAAARVLAARPPSPRALQAAARVFHRLGAWDEAVAAGEAAVQAGGGADGGGLLRESRWRDHPLPWLVEAETAKGRFARARARLAGVTARFDRVAPSLGPRAAWRLRALIDVSWFRLRWAMVDWVASPVWPDPDLASFASPTPAPPDGDAASEDDRALYAEATGVRACVEGLLAARAAWPRGEPDRLARARSAAAHLDTLAILYAAPPRFELLATQVRVATSAALEAREEIALLTAHTASLEHRLAEAGTLVPPIVRADQLAGDVHLQLRDWREAFWRYAALTRQEPQNARAWLGAARAARRLGEAAAASMARTFLGLWGGADKDRPELVEAHQIAGAP